MDLNLLLQLQNQPELLNQLQQLQQIHSNPSTPTTPTVYQPQLDLNLLQQQTLLGQSIGHALAIPLSQGIPQQPFMSNTLLGNSLQQQNLVSTNLLQSQLPENVPTDPLAVMQLIQSYQQQVQLLTNILVQSSPTQQYSPQTYSPLPKTPIDSDVEVVKKSPKKKKKQSIVHHGITFPSLIHIPQPSHITVETILESNKQYISLLKGMMNKGWMEEGSFLIYQMKLQRNLEYLAQLADEESKRIPGDIRGDVYVKSPIGKGIEKSPIGKSPGKSPLGKSPSKSPSSKSPSSKSSKKDWISKLPITPIHIVLPNAPHKQSNSTEVNPEQYQPIPPFVMDNVPRHKWLKEFPVVDEEIVKGKLEIIIEERHRGSKTDKDHD